MEWELWHTGLNTKRYSGIHIVRVFILSLKHFMVYYFDVSSGLARIKLFLLVCDHIENIKQFTLNKFGR